MNKITINGRVISELESPYIIAEISANHNGNIENAFKLIDIAANAGADAVKIQTYRADTITLDSDLPDFQITEGLWAGRTLYELYDSAHTPWEWHPQLFEYAKKANITIFSSPFDNTAVDFLEDLNAPAYKIASFEAVDLALIKYVASTGKPMIISTGMAGAEEIREAICAAKDGGCKELAILHCVSGYPAPAADYNLRTITDMVDKYGIVTGLSDHTIDNITSITSVALGASIIEKHVTLDRNGGGADDSFSLEPEGLVELCKGAKVAWSALGEVDYGMKSSECGNVQFRRSLYFIEDMKAGDTITEDCIRSVRPGYGLSPKTMNNLLGKTIKIDAKKNMPVTWDYL